MNNKNRPPFNNQRPPAIPPHMMALAPNIATHRPEPPKPLVLDEIPQPCADLVLVERVMVDLKSELIDIPMELIEKETTCNVVAIGPGRETDWGHKVMPCCKVGDRVFVPPGQGFPLKVQGRAMFLVPNNQIVAIFPKSVSGTSLPEVPPLMSEDTTGAGAPLTETTTTQPSEA